MKVTPLEISTATKVSMAARISIRSSLALASAVVERGSLTALASGSSHLLKRDSSKHFLILPPIYLILYTGYAYAVGMEWNHPALTGVYNSEQFFWLYLPLIIGVLILLVSSLSMFTKEDAPEFNPRNIRIYIGLMTIFLLLFAMMWISDLLEVVTMGDTSTGSYTSSPVVFWVIRYLDLGVSIPLGFLALYLLFTRPKQAYPILLLFYGFFITMATAVNAMGLVMLINQDPELQVGGLVIFFVLFILAWGGFFYLIKNKLPWFNR